MSALFAAVVAARNALYDNGALRQQRLSRPVISIGNISVGGTGKTPFTIMLAELLQRRGSRVDILSRGYGRSTSGVLVADPQGTPAQFGDEPLLMARRLGDVPVIVGERRYEAGVEAERRFHSDLHLLDDGFQHRQLARDFDIVLLGERDWQDRLLPSGRLREPLSSLQRADAIVVSGAEDFPALPASGLLPQQNSKPAAHAAPALWRVRRRIEVPPDCPSRSYVFCAIASPERLLRDLQDAGVHVAGHRLFRDHHRYSERDIAELRRSAARSGADGFLTTEKDAVKLELLSSELSNLHIVRLALELENSEAALELILAKLGKL